MPVFAQDSRTKIIVEDEVVIEDSFKSLEVSDSAVRTEVIHGSDIEKKHYSNAAEVLDQLPGVHLSQTYRREGQAASIQGLSEDHVLVIIDGVRQEQTSSYGFDLSQIAVDDIEKIEVVKGGASALYGSQAMGGVINITTKKIKKPFSYQIKLEGGQQSATTPTNANLNFSGRQDKFSYKFNSSFRQDELVNRDENTISTDRPEATKWNGELFLNYGDKQTKLFSKFKYFSEDLFSVTGSPTPLGGAKEFRTSTNAQTQSVTLGIEHRLAQNNQLKFQVSGAQTDDELNLRDDPTTAETEQLDTSLFRSAQADITWKNLFANRHLVTTGLSYSQNYLNRESASAAGFNVDVDDKNFESVEFFVQDEIFLDKIEVVPGFRAISDSTHGEHFSPKLSSKYTIDASEMNRQNLMASVGTGYRVPSLKERFYYLDHIAIDNYIVEGNENLRPESSVSLQVGADWSINKKHSLYANLFNNRVKDMIRQDLVNTGTPRIYRYQNISEVDIRGLELQASSHLFSRFKVSGSYTFTQSDILNSDKDLAFAPENIYRAGLEWAPVQQWVLSTEYRFEDKQFVNEENTLSSPAYGIMDLKANFEYEKATTFYFGINNVLDTTRPAAADSGQSTNDQRPAAGSYYYLGLRVST